MSRIMSLAGVAIAIAGIITPLTAFSQAPDAHEHAHMGPVVSCTDLATPPWTGLPDTDREQLAILQQELVALSTPEAAKAAGFNPVLGDIPGMGVHYINITRAMRGKNLDVNIPDQLLFASIDGQDQLVGAAYSFTDVPDTDVPSRLIANLPPGMTILSSPEMVRLYTCCMSGSCRLRMVRSLALTSGYPTVPQVSRYLILAGWLMKQTLTGFGMFHSRSCRSCRTPAEWLAPRRPMAWPAPRRPMAWPALQVLALNA